MPEYFQKVISSFSDMYSANNPEGYINLSVAQNQLTSEMVANAWSRVPPIPKENLTYTAWAADPPCAEVVARFMSTHITRQPIRFDELIFTCGASGALDLLCFALCDPDEAVLIVGPGYRGFENDAAARAGVRITVADLDESDNYAVSADALERGWQRAGGDSSGIRGVIVCSPGNPTGEILSRATITEIVAWGRRRGLHIVFDELYALSTHGDLPFLSVAEVLNNELGDDVHILWALSKDLAASGLRFGVLLTHAKLLRERVARISLFCDVSRAAQWCVQHMLADERFVDRFLKENRVLLGKAYKLVTGWLDKDKVPYIPAHAGFFVWIDLGKWVEEPRSVASEMALWQRLLDCKVILSPGSECYGPDPGWFRICFAAVAEEELILAWERVRKNVLWKKGELSSSS